MPAGLTVNKTTSLVSGTPPSGCQSGLYFYDFKSSGFSYTSPSFSFPYPYNFNLNPVVFYFPDQDNCGHHHTNSIRCFYVFGTRQVVSG